MPLYGHELSEDVNPFEAGLGFACHLVGYDFPGRDALKRLAEQPLRRVRVGLELAGRRIARHGAALVAAGKPVGQVTSGTFSPTLQKSIAMGYVPPQAGDRAGRGPPRPRGAGPGRRTPVLPP
jgi:aminomethyltransferase